MIKKSDLKAFIWQDGYRTKSAVIATNGLSIVANHKVGKRKIWFSISSLDIPEQNEPTTMLELEQLVKALKMEFLYK